MGRINVFRTKEIKEAIAASPDKAQEIIDNEKELGICVTDENGNYVYVNERYNQIYGYQPGELPGKPFTLVVPPENHKQLQNAHALFIKSPLLIMKTKTRRTHNLNCRLTVKAPCKARGFSI